MIYVKRASPPACLDMKKKGSKARKELADAIKHERRHGVPPPTTHFQVYGDTPVRTALNTMFHGKCAFCESTVSETSDINVEHYRPKGRVRGENHPGYWWLAMNWENLLLSCAHCNQPRRQIIIHEDMTLDEIEDALLSSKKGKETRGKHDHFPLQAGGMRATCRTDDHIQERPAILCPTENTDPETVIAWSIDFSSLPFMRAADAAPHFNDMIDILGLNRRYLFEQRRLILASLLKNLEKLEESLDAYDASETDEGRRNAQLAIEASILPIHQSTDPQKPYAAMSRAVLRRALEMVER